MTEMPRAPPTVQPWSGPYLPPPPQLYNHRSLPTTEPPSLDAFRVNASVPTNTSLPVTTGAAGPASKDSARWCKGIRSDLGGTGTQRPVVISARDHAGELPQQFDLYRDRYRSFIS